MNTTELKAAIAQLAKDDPDFFRDLIGDIVKENLHIQEQERDYYARADSPVNPMLCWGESPRTAKVFSYA